MNTFQCIAIRPACMVFARNIELRQLSMSNMIVQIRKHRRKSNARCCTCGLRVVRWILSMRKTADRWGFGGSGLRRRKDNR